MFCVVVCGWSSQLTFFLCMNKGRCEDLMGVKEKLVAFLTFTPYGDECSRVSLHLGNHFHPWENCECMGLRVLISAENKRVSE